jgi:hypothetical protein
MADRPRAEVAAFILREADAIGMAVGTNGNDLVVAPAPGMPSASYISFRQAILAHADEIIDAILTREGSP